MKCVFLIRMVLVAGCLLAMNAHGQGPQSAAPANADGRHTLNLKDADIQALIATVSEITGKNFILGPNVQGKVTVISAKPMKPDEIYDVFLSVLRVHGYAAIAQGSMIKIVPEAMAQQDGSAALNGDREHSTDELITQIVPVKHVSANELIQILRPLMPQGGQLVAHGASNSLVISDRAGNVARLINIIHRIDTVSDAEVEVIPLAHANAAEMARTLTSLADDKAAQANAEAPRVFADTRTNSILLAGAKNARLKLRALIAHLDTPLENGGDTQVIYLRNANAKDLVPILQGVAATLTGIAPPTAAPTGAASATGSASTATIQAHEQTNALVISAPPAVFRSLASVVRQLDVRRAQVLIEAIIAEVADSTASEIGVQWFTAPQRGDGTLGQGMIGGTNFPGPNGNSSLTGLATNPLGLSGLGGLSLGYVDGTIKIPGTDKEILNLGALVRALRGDGKTNILSTPSILTLDNQEAEIKVAQEVPFLTGSYTNTASSGQNGQVTNPFQTIERKDVGLVLKVTPHVNEGDAVRMEIHQEVSSLAPPVTGAVDLVTNKRELSTSVLVADNSLLVLGGLIDSNVSDSNSKVPGLGSIPLIGNLFRYRSNKNEKRDLMVFLRPQILRDAATEASVSSEKYNYMRTEQLRLREEAAPLTPRSERPLLPEVHDFLSDPGMEANGTQSPTRRNRQ
ncbi:MAG TPA: type II secretion system secretin GspD [Dokdonella sp.]|uniref:type II secretion system secretin GspD n=2 Tax=Dokdonella sp. TaxID=2291710 RepID=UPI002BF476C8|nr:type II secretion system secretin GspD [Dokdonella sp.]HPG94354.1 type II secretion system secretin GspD [Dokdonella sp.]HPN80427.1 type II secretion system secretin GspD [Dokdonella sp.]